MKEIKYRRITRWDDHGKPQINIEIKESDYKNLISEIEQLENIADETDDYDSGLLNDFGGGDVVWWQNYIRTEIQRCNEHWRETLKE